MFEEPDTPPQNRFPAGLALPTILAVLAIAAIVVFYAAAH